MLRSMRPYLIVAVLVGALLGVAYDLGAPVWFVYAALLAFFVAIIPFADRWSRREPPW